MSDKPNPTASSESQLFEAALEIANEHRALLEKTRAALENGDNATALKFARALCGLT
jgi:hypothetical protein